MTLACMGTHTAVYVTKYKYPKLYRPAECPVCRMQPSNGALACKAERRGERIERKEREEGKRERKEREEGKRERGRKERERKEREREKRERRRKERQREKQRGS